MTTELTSWLLESDEPWTRYRALVDLRDLPEEDADVRAARKATSITTQCRHIWRSS